MPSLREVEYKDPEGRLFRVLIPENDPDDAASRGIVLGPPRLTDLNLPLSFEVRLHNELYHRSLIEKKDVLQRRQDILGAIQAAARTDIERIFQLY